MDWRYILNDLIRAGCLLLICLLFVFPVTAASAEILAKRDGRQLTTAQVTAMISVGEHIAQQHFTAEEKQALTRWAGDLFRQEPDFAAVLRGFAQYPRYLQLAAGQRDAAWSQLIWHHLYREMVFKWRFPRYQKDQLTLLDVIRRYNPPLRTLTQEGLLLAQKDALLLEQGEYFLSGPMFTMLQLVTEFLARGTLSPEQSEGLQQWALADFTHAPQRVSKVYASFFDFVFPNALMPASPHAQEQYHHTLYQQYYFSFRDDPVARQWDRDLMDIVLRLNPVLVVDEQKRLALSQSGWQQQFMTEQLMAGVLQQQLDILHTIQQNTLQRHRELGNSMSRAIADQSFRHSIGITGGKILETHKDHYYIENARGERYTILRSP